MARTNANAAAAKVAASTSSVAATQTSQAGIMSTVSTPPRGHQKVYFKANEVLTNTPEDHVIAMQIFHRIKYSLLPASVVEESDENLIDLDKLSKDMFLCKEVNAKYRDKDGSFDMKAELDKLNTHINFLFLYKKNLFSAAEQDPQQYADIVLGSVRVQNSLNFHPGPCYGLLAAAVTEQAPQLITTRSDNLKKKTSTMSCEEMKIFVFVNWKYNQADMVRRLFPEKARESWTLFRQRIRSIRQKLSVDPQDNNKVVTALKVRHSNARLISGGGRTSTFGRYRR